MKFKKIPFCYFPSTIVLVDDSKSFTDMMQLTLSYQIPCKAFNDPLAALRWIQQHANSNLLQQLASLNEEAEEYDDVEENILINLRSIHEIIYDSQRFALPTVAVIDYAMPALSGTDLCQQLIEYPLQKLMLTGNTDHNTAVAAFNEGIIDKFLFKSSEDKHIRQLQTSIDTLQINHFNKLSAPWYRQLPRIKAVIEQADFITLFNDIIDQHNIIEFYLLDKWGSYLLLDEQGKPFILAIRDKETCASYAQVAELADETPSADILNALNSQSHFPFFYSAQEHETPTHQ